MTVKQQLNTLREAFNKARKAVGRFLTSQDQRDANLLAAVDKGDIAKVQTLLAEGGNPNKASGWREEGVLLSAVEKNNPEMLRVLLAAKADPNLKHGYGDVTALSVAVKKGDMTLITLLLDGGADVDTRVDKNLSIFAYAVAKKNQPLADLLRTRGARTDTVDKHGWTPLFYAARNGDDAMVQTLLGLGARTYLRDADGRGVMDVAVQNEKFVTRGIIQAHLDAQVPAWQAVNDDAVAHVSILRQQGYRLTEVFNFAHSQCTTITHNFSTGRDHTVVRRFDEVGNQPLIDTAKSHLKKPAAQPAAGK